MRSSHPSPAKRSSSRCLWALAVARHDRRTNLSELFVFLFVPLPKQATRTAGTAVLTTRWFRERPVPPCFICQHDGWLLSCCLGHRKQSQAWVSADH